MNLYIPRHPSKITLKQFVAYHAAKSDAEKVQVITGMSHKTIGKLQVDTIDKIIGIFEQACAIQTDHVPVIRMRSGLRIKKLGFIPDLERITLDEYREMDTLRTAIWTKNRTLYQYLPEMMAVLYRPVRISWPFGKYYRIKAYDADSTKYYKEFIDNLPMSVVNSALLFFSALQNRLLKDFPAYSVTQMKAVVESLRVTSEAHTDGLR